jgi:hypothetical protein
MSQLQSLDVGVFSERGFDKGLEDGQFNTVANGSSRDFYEYWLKQTTQFEKSLDEKLGRGNVFVSDHIPQGKTFCIEVCENARAVTVFDFVLSYLENTHPDASVIISNLFGSPMPAASLVIGAAGCALEQDVLAWYLDRAVVEAVKFRNLQTIREEFSKTDISAVYPWLGRKSDIWLRPSEFWSMIYSGEKLIPMGTPEDDWRGYEFGYKVIGRLRDCILDHGLDREKFFLSFSLPKRRIVKIECSQSFLDEGLLDEIARTVTNIDKTWGARLSVFEDLTAVNSYAGGIVVLPGGELVCEGFKDGRD